MTGFPVTINGNTYTESDFENYGWRLAIPDITRDIAKATEASNSAATAVAAATSADYPFITTAGTSTAYTVDFTPDRTVVDGFSARINFHTTSGSNPTLTVDGTSTKGLVDGSRFDGTGAYINIVAGRIPAGFNAVVMYDSTIDKYVVFNLPLKGAVSGISRASISLTGSQTFALNDEGVEQYFTGTANTTWTVAAQATINFPVDADIPIGNRSSNASVLTITMASGVIVESGGTTYTAKGLTLLKGEFGRLKKIGTDLWLYHGDNREGWA
jgi:hypothetical protein